MRNSARKQLRNHSEKSKLHTLERNFSSLLTAGKKDDAVAALRTFISALDKAAKKGVVHHAMASRKKSRLSVRLHAAK